MTCFVFRLVSLSVTGKVDRKAPSTEAQEISNSNLINHNDKNDEDKPLLKAEEKSNNIQQEQDKGVEEVYGPVYQMIPQQQNKVGEETPRAKKVVRMVNASTQTVWKKKKRSCCILC